jgi:CO/xanthine dehydrogenase Mo-binding subunit
MMAEPIPRDATEADSAGTLDEDLRLIGTPFRRVDGRAKVTGATRFADDLTFPRMAHMRLVRSTVPHALIRSIDFSKAEAIPGVLGFLTGEQMQQTFGILPVSQDEHALCIDRVRMVGDPVAAVAATTEDAAIEAALAVEVEYEPLTTIASLDEALETPEPRIHDYPDEGGNIHKLVSMEFGAVDEALDEAEVVLEDTFFYDGNTHLPMEQHSAVAVPEDEGKITLYSATQTPHYVHRALTRVLELPASRIRIIACPNGGGFGGKSDPFNHEIVAARMALNLGRPVKVTLTREEVFYCQASPGADATQDRLHSRRQADRPASQDRSRRRCLRQLWRSLDLLHRRPADGDLRSAPLPVRRRPGLHQQGALRPQAWPRYPSAALRMGSAARQSGSPARDRPRGAPPEEPGRGRLGDCQLVAYRLDGTRTLY